MNGTAHPSTPSQCAGTGRSTSAAIPLAVGAVLLLPSGPAAAQSLLEQLGREAAAIVRSARGGVVSIEDAGRRTAGLHLQASVAEEGNEAVKAAVERSVRAAQQALRSAKEEIADLEKQGPAGREKARELRKKLQDRPRIPEYVLEAIIRPQLESLRRGLAGLGRPAGLKAGTGFSIGDGYVVTTADVLEGMASPVVVTDEGLRVEAATVGTDEDLNIGLVRLKGEARLPAVAWGDSRGVAAGHLAIAIGNQTGQPNSASLALVSGIRTQPIVAARRIYPSLIQIAGTVGLGASGAPLVDARGQVIGMLAGVFAGDPVPLFTHEEQMPPPPAPPGTGRAPSPSAMATAMLIRPPVTSAGFAIPSHLLQPALDRLKEGKAFTRGWIGISPAQQATEVSDLGMTRIVRTVRVDGVWPNSPASEAGIEPGDVLVSLDGKAISTSSEVRATSIGLRAGQTLEAVVERGGQRRTLKLKILPRPAKIDTEPRREPRKSSRLDGHLPSTPRAIPT